MIVSDLKINSKAPKCIDMLQLSQIGRLKADDDWEVPGEAVTANDVNTDWEEPGFDLLEEYDGIYYLS